MNLPPMCPANTSATIISVRLDLCWIAGCHNNVDPKDELGLCDGCLQDLRVATNEGTMQELAA